MGNDLRNVLLLPLVTLAFLPQPIPDWEGDLSCPCWIWWAPASWVVLSRHSICEMGLLVSQLGLGNWEGPGLGVRVSLGSCLCCSHFRS